MTVAVVALCCVEGQEFHDLQGTRVCPEFPVSVLSPRGRCTNQRRLAHLAGVTAGVMVSGWWSPSCCHGRCWAPSSHRTHPGRKGHGRHGSAWPHLPELRGSARGTEEPVRIAAGFGGGETPELLPLSA